MAKTAKEIPSIVRFAGVHATRHQLMPRHRGLGSFRMEEESHRYHGCKFVGDGSGQNQSGD